MQKGKEKTRDIKFFSEKNQTMICVHTPEAREYAKSLEEQSGIKNYETNRVLELEHFSHVNPVGIRPDYFKTVWVSDFFLRYSDGSMAVREIVRPEMLQKRAVIERLELSRRYWAALDIKDWRIVLFREMNT
nr:hypothetical protein [uncultured Oscillibacter sp.]